MAYSAPTPASIKAQFTEFTDVPAPKIQDVIDEMGRYLDQSWVEGDYNRGYALLVAHVLIMQGSLQSSAAAQLGPAASQGAIKSFSLGDGSVTFEGRAGAATDTSILQLSGTNYGVRYRAILRANKGGPRVLNQS